MSVSNFCPIDNSDRYDALKRCKPYQLLNRYLLSDRLLNEICRNRCADDALTCVENCDTTDTNCISSCLRGEADCNEECPCESKCVNGCSGCDNDVCPSGKSVLVLSTANDKNEPFVLDFEGN